jgi:hypothetical protein
MSNLGFLNFDKSGGFVTIPLEYVKFTHEPTLEEEEEEGVKLVRELQSKTTNFNDNDDLELLEGLQVEGQTEANKPSDNENFRNKKNEINRLKRQTGELELIHDTETNLRKANLFSIIYESKERVCTVDCSRFHPTLQKQYDIKDLFVTGM